MGTITLSLPVAHTAAQAGLIAGDLTTIQTVINGNLDNNNISPSAAIAASKIAGIGMVKIDDQVLSATQAFQFTLPAGYRHARIEAKIRSTAALRFDVLFMRFNTDNTAKYYYSYVRGSDTTVAASGNPGTLATEAQVAIVPGSTASGGLPAAVTIDIIDYASGDGFIKPFLNQSWCLADSAAGGTQSQTGGGAWNVPSVPITSVLLFCTGGTNIAAASRASLYMLP